jgi:hypothetical protein
LDDADCDGVPDAVDACVSTAEASLTDRRGCSPDQVAGCAVTLRSPDDGARDVDHFRWVGDCDISHLQTSDDPTFPVAATSTLYRGPAQELAAPDGLAAYWRVVGGLEGRAHGATTPARELK